MGFSRNRIKTLAPIALSLASFACLPANPYSAMPGHYEGFVVITAQGGSRQLNVSADVAQAPDGTALELKAASTDAGSAWKFRVAPQGASSIQVSSDDASFPKANLSQSGSCYGDGKKDGDRLCADGNDITLNLSDTAGTSFSFMMEKMDTEKPPQLEPPAAYSVADLMARAQSQNFDTLIEYQKVVQARLNAESAYLNLLPHFNGNDVLNILSFSTLTMLKSIGDVVPFLIPSNWLHAKGAQFQSKSEFQGWLLMKADAMALVEGLSYSVIRDEVTSKRLADSRVSVGQIRDEILAREKTGLLQAGSADDISAVLNSIDQAALLLRQKMEQERADLANGSGFYNPEAISDVALPETMPDIQTISGEDSLKELALERSVELQQMDSLIESARLGVVSSYFGWLDPNGGGVNAGLGNGVSVAKSQVKQLMATRNQLEADLLEKTSDAFDGVNDAVASYANAQDGIAIQQRRVQRLMTNLDIGIGFSLSDLVSALQASTQSVVAQVDSEFAYYAAAERLNRLTFQGPYASVLITPAPK